MTSKERIQAVLAQQMPDKVPWGEWAIDFDTVEKIIGHYTYYRAKSRSTLAFWNGCRDEVVQSWKEDGIDFFRKMDNFDIINVAAMASSIAPPRDFQFEKPKKIDDNTWEFLDGTVYKFSEVTADVTKIYDPHIGKKQYTPADFEGQLDMEPPDESCFEVVDAFIDEFGNDSQVQLILHSRTSWGVCKIKDTLLKTIKDRKVTNVKIIDKSFNEDEYQNLFSSF